ncbi:hypothetical protein [Streptosporangium vulgare]|uniref:hypothetical protein n=1 Tax=Streptosporangium vulgare TaxID=46190 RepID=UPI0031D80E6A
MRARARARQALGYLQPITQEELDRRDGLRSAFSGWSTWWGRDGLESVYDVPLRGTPGMRRVQVDRSGQGHRGGAARAARPGRHAHHHSIDARVQTLAEKALAEAVKGAPKGRRGGGGGAGRRGRAG